MLDRPIPAQPLRPRIDQPLNLLSVVRLALVPFRENQRRLDFHRLQSLQLTALEPQQEAGVAPGLHLLSVQVKVIISSAP